MVHDPVYVGDLFVVLHSLTSWPHNLDLGLLSLRVQPVYYSLAMGMNWGGGGGEFAYTS